MGGRFVCINKEDNFLILCQERFNVHTEVCQYLCLWAGQILVSPQVAELLKIRSIAGCVFLTCWETDAVSANDVDNDAVFIFDGEVSPLSHS